ncbi:LSM domain-containing protein [Toxoplasma gondii TgCatPRC2]|uniref:Small nuclear ribonucleoprotein Sm D3 n=15 Tax=Toxoplasma gondii TaxID=5811 RepID=B9PJJ4_TOXGV|nr:LSM domain-containing protein [Toxoplasma gondii ME49]EPR60838.1 LSM domain-containing protein [Toxoplasma gondii GT1]ESS34793.1 LSM domain-containing protein [Toxoplasma gondii VEG]KAF4639151.1 LSM domain-containing protein [Toxoplasma gondii]KFG40679.1 LSM domain-containing protein [Toxoplasma gondii p89]KFG44667.1 LSM domain-containing protein [Toxoplasma gondii GAB2-2007-GAL-DOM2]KFG55732.1 LSM domain-containing protein [Toxoplasma gondii FOU]KFG57812.1 LSM domain-containing protein [|eukprot:XP_002364221.1 LSM domain-containing protein [Toxoplasma gondii ME49]
MATVGTPVKLLYEGLGHTVTVEIKSGEVYRGVLENAEDNMNCLLQTVTVTHRDGRVVSLEQVYIRGSQVKFIVFPDMLRHAPFFRMVDKAGKYKRALGLVGMRRAMNMRARGARVARARGGGRGGGRGGMM